jgi:glycosyltransferase involved in cell wall biosynthesis
VDDKWDLGRFRGIHVLDDWQTLFRENSVTHLLVEGWRFSALWQAVSAARKSNIAVWMRAESNDLSRRGILKAFIRRIALNRLFRHVDAFLCIGTANRRFYRTFDIDESKLIQAPYCVDNQRFAESANSLRSQRLELRRRWGIPEDKFCILFCGKFIPKKRPLDLVGAAAIVGDSVHLLFVGDGDLRNQLQSSVEIKHTSFPVHSESRGNQPTASFVGFLNQRQIAEAYIAADCLVLPSDAGETWGLVVNEAMAAGLPCIVSDHCGCGPDLIPPEFVFPLGDRQRLADCIRRMQTKPPTPEFLAERIGWYTPAVTASAVSSLLRRGALGRKATVT